MTKPGITAVLGVVLSLIVIGIWLLYGGDSDIDTEETTNEIVMEGVGDALPRMHDDTEQTVAAGEELSVENYVAAFDEDTIRTKYVNSQDLPDGIAFAVSILGLVGSSGDNPEMAVAIIGQKMRLKEEDAEILRDRLAEINNAYWESVRDAQYELLCSGHVPKVYGDDVYDVFQTLDDVRDSLAEEKYLSLMSDLPEDYADRLGRWVDASKLNTTSIRFDFKKRYESTGKSVDAVAANICLEMSRNQE